MGSCVSRCSRQDVVHQQTGSIVLDAQKSIEVSQGSSRLHKSLIDVNVECELPESRAVTEQINAEIRALREQLVRSQVLFTYLLKDGSSEHTPKSSDGKNELRTLLEEENLGDAMFQCKSFDGQVPARLYNRSNRSSSSYASRRSTPMHCGYTSLSCPTLPVESPVVTKSTQTEPLSGVSFYIGHDDISAFPSELNHSSSKGASLVFSPVSSPCGFISDICEVHRDPDDHSYPRHRTNSFLRAVKDGNPKLIDATESNENAPQETCHEEKTKDIKLQSYTLENIEECTNIEENKECIFPRKLSILLEEDCEDASGNYFSVCSSQPLLNRKRKTSDSCNVKTQTDLSFTNDSIPTHSKQYSPKKPCDNLPVSEFGLPKCGYTLVTQAVKKRTVYSEELPRKLVLRYPPPYTKKRSRPSRYLSYGNNYFRELAVKPKTHIYKWPTVAESLPSKSECPHNMNPKSQADSSLQTRHLSLEKQESVSSYDHSLYPDSRLSSVTDCSGWMTKSDVDLNLRPEPPSYQQSVLVSQRNQSAQNRLKSTGEEKKDPERSSIPAINSDRTKTDSESRMADDKNGSKESFKISQRSMRRGSGAGSPNSQLSIPRYPAFDFDEQEDVHSFLPSPSEPEANHNLKAENLQGKKGSETVRDNDSSQSSHLKEASQKKQDASKSKTLMPEIMENSETESAKGSFEYEAPDLPLSMDVPSVSASDVAFPSLPNTFLTKLGVHKDSPLPVEAFDEQELESKFIALSLAFKTDRTTLNKRIDVNKRQRDIAEKNVENEFQAMRDHLNTLNLKATSPDVRDLISKIQNHIDIAQQATARISSRSETYGSVQQEERVSRAFEVLVLYVDHLKRLFDKEHKELEETRRLLTDTKMFKKDVAADSVSDNQKKCVRTFGLPAGSIKSVQNLASSILLHPAETYQQILCPFPTTSCVGLSSSSLPTSPVTFIPHSRIGTAGTTASCCSLPAASPIRPDNMLQSPEAACTDSTTEIFQCHLYADKHPRKGKDQNIAANVEAETEFDAVDQGSIYDGGALHNIRSSVSKRFHIQILHRICHANRRTSMQYIATALVILIALYVFHLL